MNEQSRDLLALLALIQEERQEIVRRTAEIRDETLGLFAALLGRGDLTRDEYAALIHLAYWGFEQELEAATIAKLFNVRLHDLTLHAGPRTAVTSCRRCGVEIRRNFNTRTERRLAANKEHECLRCAQDHAMDGY